MKTLTKLAAALAVVAMAASPASALSKSYCKTQATQTANRAAAGKTIVGAGLGCLFGQLIAKKCGTGALVGGGGGFLIGSAQWKQVYWNAYHACRNA